MVTLSLELLQQNYVFEATPVSADLGPLHVRFDELTGVTSTEVRVSAAINRGEPVALIGRSGSGKSSVIAHILGPLAEDLAPMTVPVAAMSSEIVDSPASLVDHLLGTVALAAKKAMLVVDTDDASTATVTTRSSRRSGFGDDTDRWLRSGGSSLATAFFAETIRWVRGLPTGLVVAVHLTYFDASSRAEVLKYLDTQVDIPVLSSAAAIEAILQRRVEQYTGIDVPNLDAVLDLDVAGAVLAVYRETGSLRRALQVCHIALHEAVGASADKLSEGHIAAALSAG